MINEIGPIDGVLLTKQLSDITPKKDYTISKIRKVRAKYGTRIVSELMIQFAVFLPKIIMQLFKDPDYEDTFENLAEAIKTKRLYFHCIGGPCNHFEPKYMEQLSQPLIIICAARSL